MHLLFAPKEIMNTTTIEVPFATIKESVRSRFEIMSRSASDPGNALLRVEYDRDEIWNTYLNAFPEETRQEHNCNCCKAFIRQVGGAVLVRSSGERQFLWDAESPSPGVRALAAYVASRPIAGLFYHEGSSAGTDKNLDRVRNVTWEHFHVVVPWVFINDERGSNTLGRKSAEVTTLRDVFVRAVKEITPDALQTVKELIDAGSLYRGPEYKNNVVRFAALRETIVALSPEHQETQSFLVAATEPQAVTGIRNTAIGTLLVDLSTGRDLDDAVKAFERIVAPANYKRPTALVTPRMVEAAKKTLSDLGFLSALDRRRLDDRDLTAADALFVYRPSVKKGADVFASLTDDTPVDLKELKKVEEVSSATFFADILPNAKEVRVLVERGHLGNLATLTGPVDADAPSLMKWDNSYAWSFTGGVADAIKERVKAAGGKVDGWLRASLAWQNYDDLDLHFKSAREHVYFGNSRGREAWLDVDMNAGHGQTREPVENITVNQALKPGDYEILVNQFCRREEKDSGYTLEIEVNGETRTFGKAKSPRGGTSDHIKFRVLPDGQVVFEGGEAQVSAGISKWGVTTGRFTKVRAITLSPNHWTRPIGNKIWFFLLDGCVSDEATRPFYNEFLVDALAKDRKTMEALAGKIEVAPAQGAELSGLGFSETQRNHLFVQVDGTFKRTVKVLF